MTFASLNSNSSRVTLPDSRSIDDCEIDEALWAAYRRYDKSAVTEELLRRYLTAATAVARRSYPPLGGFRGIRRNAQLNRLQTSRYKSSSNGRKK
jgi:hypothetical protein